MTEDAGYRANSKDTTVWYLISSRAIAESEAILQIAYMYVYLFHASSQELRSVTCRFSVLHFLADFGWTWIKVVCVGTARVYIPWLIWSCRFPCKGGAHEMDAMVAALERWCRLCQLWCLRLWRQYLWLNEDEVLVDEVYEEVDKVDRELSLWWWWLHRGNDTSDSDEVL